MVGNPISVLSGNKEETETDLRFNTPHERDFKLYRTYKSSSDTSSTLGFGWTHNYHVVLEQFLAASTYAYQIIDESNRNHHYQDIDGDGIFTGILSSKGSLVHESDGSFTWHRANDITYTFNQNLKFIAKTDGSGNVQSLTYDTEGRLETVTDQATGRVIGFHYNTDNRIDYITGPVTAAVPDGIWVRYQYDTTGNLTRVEYADSNNGSGASGFEYIYADPSDPHNLTEKRNLAGEFLSSWQYDTSDRALQNITRDGKGVSITYNSGSVVVMDAQGAQKTYTIATVDGRRRITAVTGANGCTSCGGGGDEVRYGYDEEGRVNEIEHGNGRIDLYTDFDAQGRYTTEVQADGTPDARTFHYTYHPETGDRLSISESSVLGSGSKETIFDYDDDGDDTPNENPTRLLHRKIERGFTYNAAGTVEAFNHVTVYSYNAKGQVASIDGPLPGTQDLVSYTYDPVSGDRLTETRPLVGTTSYTYDAAGNVETITEPDGSVTILTYDGRNRQLSTTRDGVSQSRTYTAAGEIDTATDALGRTMDYTYNAAGFVEKIIDPSGNFIYYGYNAQGRRTAESIFSADNVQTHYRGTDWGNPAANPDLSPGKPWKSLHRNATDTADLATVYTYDDGGNLSSVTDANNKVTTYHYDLFGRLYQVIQPGNVVTTYGYDRQGNLSSVTDAEGHVTTYDYDDLGRLVETDSPDTGTTLYNYNAAGNLRFKTLNAKVTEYRYDALGRLTQILYTNPAENVTMTYDTGSGQNLLGRLSSVTDASGTVAYSYNEAGRLESESRTIDGIAYETGYTYDVAGNLRSMVYPTGQIVEYRPDPADASRIGSVVLNGTRTLAADLTYKPFGPLSAMTLGNGLSTIRTYDKNYQITGISTGTILGRTYTADNVGNITAITDTLDAARTQSFAYDDLYRLTGATGIYGSMSYTYDNVGNRKSETRNSQSDSYTYYPGTNRLQAVTGPHAELFQYDDDGNTTRRIPGAANPTPAISDPADYTYNVNGQRAKKQNSASIHYHYDQSGQLIAETTATGTLIRAYVWLLGQPLAQITATGAIYYYHTDHLGTPQRLTDSTGALAWAADYLPFGKADVTVAAVENNLRFAGQYYDNETGLHYNYWRYYDPKIGRYLRADPLNIASLTNNRMIIQSIFSEYKTISGMNLSAKLPSHTNGINDQYLIELFKGQLREELIRDPRRLDLYAYVSNNPINFIDPTGEFGLGGAISGAVGGAVGGAIVGGITGGWDGAGPGAIWGGLIGGVVGFITGPVGGTTAGSIGSAIVNGILGEMACPTEMGYGVDPYGPGSNP